MKADFLPCSGKAVANSDLTVILAAGRLLWLLLAIGTCDCILFFVVLTRKHTSSKRRKEGLQL